MLLALLLACTDWDSFDGDGDGSPRSEDCDDEDPRVFPGADEVCDGVDNDCDGLVDDADEDTPERSKVTWYADEDGDGYAADGAESVLACDDPGGFPARGEGDCDDEDPRVHPAHPELCDGVDNDCDPDSDEEQVISLGDRLYEDLQEALDDADGQTVHVCHGVHEVNLLVRQAGAHLVGVPGPEGERPILDGGGEGSVLQLFGPTELEGVVLRGGLREDADGGGVDGVGAPSLVLRGVELRDNRAFNGGGVAGPLDGTLVVEDCVFEGNEAVQGGALAVFDEAEVSGTEFVDNRAEVLGGAIYAFAPQASVLLEGGRYTGNEAERGAAWWFSGISLTTLGEAADQGVASDCGGAGFLATGEWTDQASGYAYNSATNHGGAFYLEVGSGAAVLEGSALTRNEAGLTGGALSAWEAPAVEDAVVLRSALLSQNTAINGGALYLQARDARFEGVVLRRNTADGLGGAVCAETAVLVGDEQTSVEENAALSGGGLALLDSTWDGPSLVQANTASAGGGAWLDAEDIPVWVEELRFEDNSAPFGGGVVATGGSITLQQASIQDNAAEAGGGLVASGGAVLSVEACQVAGNGATEGSSAWVEAGSALGSVASTWDGEVYMEGSGESFPAGTQDFSCVDDEPWACF